MRIKEREIVIIITILLISQHFIFSDTMSKKMNRDQKEKDIKYQETIENRNYTTNSHKAISIETDSGFDKYNFDGNGSKTNPYRISNISIIEKERGIYIKNTTKYFVIEHCNILFCGIGVFIFNASAETATIANNTLAYIKDTNAIGAVGQAILISETEKCKIINNHISECDISIFLSNSEYSIIKENYISQKYGITIISSFYTKIISNTFINCGLNLYGQPKIEEYTTYIVKDNKINGKELGYFVNRKNEVFEQNKFGQLFFVNCTNLIIKDQHLFDATTGLTLYFCSSCIIENITSYSNIFEGIAIYGSRDIILYKNTCLENGFGFTGCGIRIRESTNCLLIRNICFGNKGDGGIEAILLENTIIKKNFCSFNTGEGLAVKRSRYILVKNNNCTNNGIDGIGIYTTNYSLISHNYVVNNSGTGIFAFESQTNEYLYNTLKDNTNYGINLMSAVASKYRKNKNNIVHHNVFINNNNESSQAYDNGENNYWYNEDTKEGNYWDDTNEKRYLIDGSAGSIDKYVLNKDLVKVKSSWVYSIVIHL